MIEFEFKLFMEQVVRYILDKHVKHAHETGDTDKLEGLEGLVRQLQAAEALGWFNSPDLRERTYHLLQQVRDPLPEEQKAFEKRGFTFLPIETKSLLQVVIEHPNHFRSGQREWLEGSDFDGERNLVGVHGLTYPDLKDYAPPVMRVGFHLPLYTLLYPFSNSREGDSLDTQLKKTENYSQTEIESEEFPDVRALIFPATIYAQADIAYFIKTGKFLFDHMRIRTLDRANEMSFGEIYRRYLSSYRDDPRCHVGWWLDVCTSAGTPPAAPGIVFLNKV